MNRENTSADSTTEEKNTVEKTTLIKKNINYNSCDTLLYFENNSSQKPIINIDELNASKQFKFK